MHLHSASLILLRTSGAGSAQLAVRRELIPEISYRNRSRMTTDRSGSNYVERVGRMIDWSSLRLAA